MQNQNTWMLNPVSEGKPFRRFHTPPICWNHLNNVPNNSSSSSSINPLYLLSFLMLSMSTLSVSPSAHASRCAVTEHDISSSSSPSYKPLAFVRGGKKWHLLTLAMTPVGWKGAAVLLLLTGRLNLWKLPVKKLMHRLAYLLNLSLSALWTHSMWKCTQVSGLFTGDSTYVTNRDQFDLFCRRENVHKKKNFSFSRRCYYVTQADIWSARHSRFWSHFPTTRTFTNDLYSTLGTGQLTPAILQNAALIKIGVNVILSICWNKQLLFMSSFLHSFSLTLDSNCAQPVTLIAMLKTLLPAIVIDSIF